MKWRRDQRLREQAVFAIWIRAAIWAKESPTLEDYLGVEKPAERDVIEGALAKAFGKDYDGERR